MQAALISLAEALSSAQVAVSRPDGAGPPRSRDLCFDCVARAAEAYSPVLLLQPTGDTPPYQAAAAVWLAAGTSLHPSARPRHVYKARVSYGVLEHLPRRTAQDTVGGRARGPSASIFLRVMAEEHQGLLGALWFYGGLAEAQRPRPGSLKLGLPTF